jgi:hypothetical protein
MFEDVLDPILCQMGRIAYLPSTSRVARSFSSSRVKRLSKKCLLRTTMPNRERVMASNELTKARHGRKVLVLLTDGEDQGSKSTLQNLLKRRRSRT